MNDDRRLIEDYLSIQAIRAESLREESVYIHDPATKLDHAKREIVVARSYEIPIEMVNNSTVQWKGEGYA